MLICFTGTGNTRKIADKMQDVLGDDLVRLPPGLMCNPSRAKLTVEDGRVIWLFPVHCWGLPILTTDVITDINITNGADVDHYMVCSCGDDIGYADLKWRSLMKMRGWRSKGAFSVQMPNNYVAMKGFDIDPPELAKAKLDAMPARVEEIIDKICEGYEGADVVRGKWPWVKSNIIKPWFDIFKTGTKPFHVTDSCAGCGRCARACPISCIEMRDGHPVWMKSHCIMCLRCYHCCPQHGLSYGKITEGKGQYMCPGYSIKNGRLSAEHK